MIPVRTDTEIDARDTGNGRDSGVVDRDVYDSDDKIAIPWGSNVELMVREIWNHTLALDLDAIVIKGKRYSVW